MTTAVWKEKLAQLVLMEQIAEYLDCTIQRLEQDLATLPESAVLEERPFFAAAFWGGTRKQNGIEQQKAQRDAIQKKLLTVYLEDYKKTREKCGRVLEQAYGTLGLTAEQQGYAKVCSLYEVFAGGKANSLPDACRVVSEAFRTKGLTEDTDKILAAAPAMQEQQKTFYASVCAAHTQFEREIQPLEEEAEQRARKYQSLQGRELRRKLDDALGYASYYNQKTRSALDNASDALQANP